MSNTLPTLGICHECDGDGHYVWCTICEDIPDNCDCEMKPNGDDPDHYIDRICQQCDGDGEIEA